MDATWINVIARYETALRAGDYPHGTIYLRGYHLRRFARTVSAPLDAITRDHVIAFLDSSPTWAASYKRSYRVTLRAFFRWSRREGLIASNPMKGIETAAAPIGKPLHGVADGVGTGLAGTEKDQIEAAAARK